jgi:hypothetical protein
MKLSQREDDQRWALLASSKTTPDRMMLEQYETLVQPTQFIAQIRKTMPMSEIHLDMFTTMHDSMSRRLNALEMLHKGGQRAIDEFTASGAASTAWRSEKQTHCRRPRGRVPMTAVAAAAAEAMVAGLGVGLDEQQVVFPVIRHLLPREHQVRLSTMPRASSSSTSPKESNAKNATNWGTGRKIADVQVSTPSNVLE